jgi:hypothetical protein
MYYFVNFRYDSLFRRLIYAFFNFNKTKKENKLPAGLLEGEEDEHAGSHQTLITQAFVRLACQERRRG